MLDPIEINELNFEEKHLKKLSDGHLIIIRNSNIPRKIRSSITNKNPEIKKFYENKDIPSIENIKKVTEKVKEIRDKYIIPTYFLNLLERANEKSILVDNGISRLVLPEENINEVRASKLFTKEDFKRRAPDSNTETFMPGNANIHRDFNRPHQHLQINFWFPLHDCPPNEVLRIWPQLYNSNIFDMPSSDDNIKQLGSPLEYHLNFGDILIFHSEHLHTSPCRTSESTRHTYEFRCAFGSIDDNSHYRKNYTHIKNIKNPKNKKQIIKIKQQRKPNLKKTKGESFSEEISLYRFNHKKTSKTKLKDFINRVESPYFLMKALPFIKNTKDSRIEQMAHKKAQLFNSKFTEKHTSKFNYKNKPTQMSAKEAIDLIIKSTAPESHHG